MTEQLRKHKKAIFTGLMLLAVFLCVGFLVPVKIEVEKTESVHQHTALTENDFVVQTSTLFGIRHEADGYKVSWNGWTEEQQAAILVQNSTDTSDDQADGSHKRIEAYSRHGDRDMIGAEDILAALESADSADSDGNSQSPSAVSQVLNGNNQVPQAAEKYEKDEKDDGKKDGGTPDGETAVTSSGNGDSEKTEDGDEEEHLIVTGDTVTEYTISKGSLTDTIKVDVVPVAEIRASYGEPLYYLEVPEPEHVHACLIYEDGKKINIPCTIDTVPECTAPTEVPVHTDYGDTVCPVSPIMPAELTAEYKGNVHEGNDAKASDVQVTVKFEDGHVIRTKASEFVGEAFVNDPGEFRVKNAYGETDVHIDPVPITVASIKVDEVLYEEDMLNFDEITLTYADGTTKVIGTDEVELGAEATLPLTAGVNDIPFLYNGKMYTFSVNVLHDTEIRRATIRNAEEIRTAEYSHLSDTIMVTINRHTEEEYTYLLTHIIIDDPVQIHAGLSNDDYGGERETPSSAAERLGWVVGINGSNFDYATNTPTMADAKIKNGQVMPDSKAVSNGMEICLTNSGNLFSPQQGMTVNDLLNMGVTDTWCCGDTLLISNGEAVNVGIQSLDYRYPRTAIGMVRPCEYYIITAGTTGYSNGMTYDEIRDTLMSLDCGFGKCLDGGGSSTLIFENQLLNEPATGSERPVTDFLYFTE